MGSGTAIATVCSKYVTFTGRARRSEYWYWVLFSVLLGLVAGVLDVALGTDTSNGTGLVGGIVTLALFVPTLAVTARRLHDTGRTGWWILIGFVPLIGQVVLIVFCALGSIPGDNQHGPNPKLVAA